MELKNFEDKLKRFGSSNSPFFFLIDFELKKPFVCKLEETEKNRIYFDIKGKTNFNLDKAKKIISIFKKYPVQKEIYFDAFKEVTEHIRRGDTYLVNLTFPTKLEIDNSLEDLFCAAKAPYKLLFKNEFLIFSPECFIKIIDDQIFSYPMKGTIDASIPNAEEKLLGNAKEIFEHNTIVDLIRNDLSIISTDVKVTKFRYIDKIHTNQKDLLQVSSEIRGNLSKDWNHNLNDLLLKMLPAGSICGAPKQKTVEIIEKAEKKDRGYFTGIFGIYDGVNLDCAVNIRFIEQTENGLQFRSGGGITALSDPESEYNEMINKVYVPAG